MASDETSTLICGLCGKQLAGPVKLLPCQRPVCGECGQRIETGLDSSRRFMCQACKQPHVAPTEGLEDDARTNEKLGFRSQDASPEDRARLLRSTLADVQEKVAKLKQMDRREEVNELCDSLVLEVMETVDSAVSHLNRLGNDLLNRINSYREEMLSSLRDAPVVHPASKTAKQTLYELSHEIDAFGNRIDDDEELEKAQEQAELYKENVKRLERQLRREFFGENLMRFRENHLFYLSADHLGQLVLERPAILADIDAKLLLTLNGHNRSINQVLPLPDGNIVTCSDDSTVKVWDHETGRLLYGLKAQTMDPIYSMTLLPNGWLACGTHGARVNVWNLGARSLVRTLEGHRQSVVALRVLHDSNLASYSWDDTIRIWNPYIDSEKVSPLLVIEGHQVRRSLIQLELLSNGFLVTCSNRDDAHDAVVKVWRPSDGKLVKSLSCHAKNALSILVLSSDSIALGFREGLIKIVDLVEEYRTKTLGKNQSWAVYSLLELPCGLLLCAGQSPVINVWDTSTSTLVKSIITDHTSQIWSLFFSKEGKYLVSGSEDSVAKIWSLE